MKTTITLTSLLLCITCLASTDDHYLRFRHISTDNGLSHNGVMAMYQDRRGFIWMGTQDGLNLYNGEDIRIYKFDKYASDGLLDNNIKKISGDGHNTVFIQSALGIVSYDIQENRFRPVAVTQTGAMNFQNGYLYYSIGNKIIRHEPASEKDSTIYLHSEKGIHITELYGSRDSLFIGTDRGLYFHTRQSDDVIIPDVFVRDIFRDSHGILWITSYNGMGLFSIDRGRTTQYRHNDSDPYSLCHNQTHVCCEDPEGNIWIGTFDGLCVFDRDSERFRSYRHSYSDGALSESSVWSLMLDRQGNVWAGTYYGGVNYFSPSKPDFRKYQAGSSVKNGLSSPVIGQITEDPDNNLWICTEGGGLCKYERNSGLFEWYMHDEKGNSISHNHVKCVWYDPERQAVWVGTHLGGLNRLDPATGKFTVYSGLSGRESRGDIVMSIIPFGDSLILGTLRRAIIFDPETGRTRPLMEGLEPTLQPDYIYQMILDSGQNLWIICDAGKRVCRYSLRTGEFREYPELTETADGYKKCEIISVYEDSERNIWLCTNGNGLEVISGRIRETLDRKHNGLASDVVYAIRELGPYRYILTTDAGISILDYESKSVSNYLRNHDIPLSSIRENSLFVSHNSEIFVGGTDGMISFTEAVLNPEGNTDFDICPYLLSVNGEISYPEPESGILEKDISLTESIDLKYRDNSFSLKYTVTDYLPNKKYDLKYCLEGYSHQWFPMNMDKSIRYSKLKPGKYSLVVQATDYSGHVLKEHRLGIRVRQPFYNSVWAYILYITAMSSLAIVLVRTQNNRLRMTEQLNYEKRHAEDIEKMNQEKLQFFTNISHEFRTPISVISGQVKILMEKYVINTQLHTSLSRIYRSCLQLDDLIDELLEFRKMEKGFLSIKARAADIVSFAHSYYLLYSIIAQSEGIGFIFSKSHENITAWFDRKQMAKVLNNLLSNAFKYVNKNGTITLSVRKGNNEAILEVTNTGSVIAQDDTVRIFDRFYQGGNGEKGTGIGLHLAKGIVEKHHGKIEAYSNQADKETTFCVHLPVDGKVFAEDEKAGTEGDPEPHMNLDIAGTASGWRESGVTGYMDGHMNTHDPENGGDAKRYSVLIAENDKELNAMLSELFNPFYNVLSVYDGETGYETAVGEKPDLIVSDVSIPGLDGIGLCRRLKKNRETSGIPIVLLSANAEKEQILAGIHAGADDFIKKPFDINILIAKCNNLVISHRHTPKRAIRHETHSLASNIQEQAFLNKARGIVLANMEKEDFDTADFASALGVSRTLLFTRLKNITGQTPREFVLDIKLEHAASLLESNPELNITEIADRLGFSSLKYFRKCFKEKYGVTPSEYRGSSSTDDRGAEYEA